MPRDGGPLYNKGIGDGTMGLRARAGGSPSKYLRGLQVSVPGIRFVSVSPYAFLGGAIAGTVELDFDRPSKVRDISLVLTGAERSQVTVSQGKSSEMIQDVRPFYEQAVSLRERVPFQDPEHAAQGNYQVPFEFSVPPVAPPTLETSPLSLEHGHFDRSPDGLFVDYTLKAKVDVPLWVDPVLSHRVQVLPPVRVLGGLSDAMSASSPDHPQVRVSPADTNQPWIVPGKPFSMVYAVQNPGGKMLKGFTATLVRTIDYTIRSYSRANRTVFGTFPLALEGNGPLYEGRMDLMVPDLVGMVNPGMGQIFRCSWSLEIDLGVHLGFDVKMGIPLTPPVVNLPVSSPSVPPGTLGAGPGGP